MYNELTKERDKDLQVIINSYYSYNIHYSLNKDTLSVKS